MKCLICDQEFKNRVALCNHLSRKHNLIGQQYYDEYIKGNKICKICGKETKFINIEEGYRIGCCLEHTNLAKFGVKSNLNLEETKKKAQINSHTQGAIQKGLQKRIDLYGGSGFSSEQIKEKIINTNQEKYGVDNPWKNETIQNKCKKTKLDKYGDENYNNREKAKQTNQQKYNTEHFMKLDKFKEKVKETNLQKYGVETALQLPTSIENAHTKEAQNKRNQTISKKGPIHKSEKYFVELANLNNLEYIYQYSSDEYPYFCDFYIPKLNLYIEINIHWAHGNHWFDENNIEDINELEQLKFKNSKFYNRKIEIWTKSDVSKRNTAKNNNLNYVVLWSMSEITEWFKLGCPIRKDY